MDINFETLFIDLTEYIRNYVKLKKYVCKMNNCIFYEKGTKTMVDE